MYRVVNLGGWITQNKLKVRKPYPYELVLANRKPQEFCINHNNS